ncbi:MAG: BatD family protein [Gammaproteobacteria bacterium]|jgi:hypothetical protein
MVSTKTTWLVLLLCFAINATATAATITASVDRHVIQENESLNLTFSSDSAVDAEPNFSPLKKDFSILNQTQSSEIQIINGRMNRQISWDLTLMPRHAGSLTIPAIAFGNDKSNSITLKVTHDNSGNAAKGDELVYMEVAVDHDEVYVQSQLIYTLRIYQALRLRQATLSDLKINDDDAIVETVTDKKKYEKYINGRRYQVFEKQYAIFPQTVGELVIEPEKLDAQYIAQPRILRNKRVYSKRLRIKVKPKPAAANKAQTAYWLPASNVTLQEQWSGDIDNVKVGDPITRTLTLKAVGLLSSQLPKLNHSDASSEIKQYSDQPELKNKIESEGFVGSREEKIAYIPSKPGRIKLPAIEVSWWDIKHDHLETARVPEKVINVMPVANAGSSGGAPGTEAATNPRQSQSNSGNPQATVPMTRSEIAGLPTSAWFWISVGLMALWLATIALWYYRSRNGNNRISAQPEPAVTPNSVSLKAIKAACKTKNPQQVKNTLIQWAHDLWPDDPPNSVGHLAQKVDGQFADELQRLNTVLYKPDGKVQWNAEGLWQAIQAYNEQQRNEPRHEKPVIQPLYKVAVIRDEPAR